MTWNISKKFAKVQFGELFLYHENIQNMLGIYSYFAYIICISIYDVKRFSAPQGYAKRSVKLYFGGPAECETVMKTEKKQHVILRPERVRLTGSCIKFADAGFYRWKIPYRKIVWAGIDVYDCETGALYEPEITEITEEMKGDLLFLDIGNCYWRIRTDLWEKAAGAVLAELAVRAPYILIGAQPWLAEEAGGGVNFAEIADMVEMMRRS